MNSNNRGCRRQRPAAWLTGICLLSGVALSAHAVPGTTVLNAKPVEVTVYSDRAQVTRSVSKTLSAGPHVLVFDNLPSALDQNSIQVSGEGKAALLDVKFKKVYVSTNTHARVKPLQVKKQGLEDRLIEIQDKINQAKAEKQFIINISVKLTSTGPKTAAVPLDPNKWVKMVRFYRTKQTKLDQEIRTAKRRARDVKKQIAVLDRQINALGSQYSKVRNQVHVKVDVKQGGKLKLNLAYVVTGPGWRPVYDLRVDSQKGTMKIVYNAVVRQSTSEDWNNVRIKLSTAKPVFNGQQPKLTAVYVNLFDNLRALLATNRRYGRREYMRRRMVRRYRAKTKRSMAKESDEVATGGAAPAAKPAPVMTVSRAKVESQATSAVFVIKNPYTIKSNNDQHKVSINSSTLKARLMYSIVPKLTQHAYLKTQVTNKTDFPLLAGSANVFLDNSFVANTRVRTVAPGEKFWTYLGVDEGIKVEYKFINKFLDTSGLINKSKRYTYDYEIRITNNKKREAEMLVFDQVPISRHEDVKVALLKPVVNKDTKNIKINKHKFIEWYFKAAAGKKIVIPFKYSVEHPADKVMGSSRTRRNYRVWQ